MTIAALERKIKSVNFDKLIHDSLENTKGSLADINRERMLDGVRADGSIMPTYSYISQTVYGYPNSPIKLKATGAFQAAIKVDVLGSVIKTDSTDSKSEMLQERYGIEIFGSGGDYKKQFIKESLNPEFISNVHKATGL